MLVMTIRLNETIIVGDDIRVTLTKVQNGQVKIGIDAPKALAIDRASVRERKDAERAAKQAEGQEQQRA